ncbi:Auxin_efflux carrier [Hexamita inflata]|uniref:Auxin_efflux carrier n=1 Tax=Hexamita inflata TaxID=28002 RepID=A0ABP1GFL8_9EUKA
MSQNIAIPVRTLYFLATEPFSWDDLKLICSLLLAQLAGALILIPFLFIFKVQTKLKTFAALLSIIQINNYITAVPFYSGVFSKILPKYAYMQIMVDFGICLPIINICFEHSVQNCKLIKIIGQQLLQTIKHPQIIATFIGIFLNYVLHKLNVPKILFVEKISDFCGALIPPFGLLSGGMLIHQQYIIKKNTQKDGLTLYSNKSKYKYLRIITLQLLRHGVLPMIFMGICKGFKVKQQNLVEMSVSIYAQPCQILTFTLCSKYNQLIDEAVFDLVFGTLTVFILTPLLQIICQKFWE